MGQLYVDQIDPQSGTSLTIGESGQNTVIPGNDIRANVLQDAGGNAIFTSNGSGTLSGINSGFGSALVHIQTQTVSSSQASLAFTSGIDSTYNTYRWKAYYIAPSTTAHWGWDVSTDGGSAYNTVNGTTAMNRAYMNSGNTSAGWSGDMTTATSNSTPAYFMESAGTGFANRGACFELTMYNVASTTFWKQYQWKYWGRSSGDATHWYFGNGYWKTTSAINAVRFKYSTGTIETGTFKMWGIK